MPTPQNPAAAPTGATARALPPAPSAAQAGHGGRAAQRRPVWLRTLHQWHWISSALGLVGLLLFSVTGLTLNHAGLLESRARVSQREFVLSAPLQALLAPQVTAARDAPLPEPLRRALAAELEMDLPTAPAEWSAQEVYVSLPRPGGDAWLRIDRGSGEVEYERTDRGWIAWLNDLHKGRHAGAAWSLFIDAIAVASVFSCATGLLILALHARQRPSTWPMVATGLIVPLLIALLLIH